LTGLDAMNLRITAGIANPASLLATVVAV